MGMRMQERLPLPLVLCREDEVSLHLVPIGSIHPPEVACLLVMGSTVWDRHFPLASFPGSHAPEHEIEVVQAWRAWCFFSHKKR